jgi:hypothetical protein
LLEEIEEEFFPIFPVGTVRAMSDVSRILASLVVAHYGGAGHRPRWIGLGAILLGLGMFLMASTEAIFPVTSRSLVTFVVSSASDSNEKFCHVDGDSSRSSLHRAVNATMNPACSGTVESSLFPLIVLGIAEFIMGLGATSIVILALPFIDDNVSTRNSPLYFGDFFYFNSSSCFQNIHFFQPCHSVGDFLGRYLALAWEPFAQIFSSTSAVR